MGLGLDPRRHADQDALAGARGDSLEPVDLVERVDDHVTDPGGERRLEVGLGLVVAVHVDPLGREARRAAPGAARLRTPRRRTGPPRANRSQRGGAGERLARVEDLEARRARGEGRHRGPRPLAHVVLRVDVRGGAELARQLERVAAADLQPAGGVQPRAERIDAREPAGEAPSPASASACSVSSPAIGWAIMKHDPPAPPELGTRDGLAYALFVPDGRAGRRRRDPARRRLGEGEPLRLRPPLPRPRARRAWPTTRAATAGPTAHSGRAPSTTRWPCATCCESTPPRVALRGSSMGGLCAIHAAAARRGRGRGRGYLPRPGRSPAARPALGCAARLRRGPRGPRAVARVPRHLRGGGLAGAATRRCCCCTRAGTSRCPTR